MESIKALRPLKNQLGNIEHCEPHFSMSEKKTTYTTPCKIHAAGLVRIAWLMRTPEREKWVQALFCND